MHKPVLVTGASSGIGEATAVHLAQKGFRVFAAARRVQKLQELSALGGGRITPIAMDVTDEGSIDKALSEIAADGATLYGLVNNAGIAWTGPALDMEPDAWDRVIDTNLNGAFY
ncbi:MAG: SDR family NAD(P)-dependent oxidoreductase, partial [Pseudomonadota bacterium]